jgi:hypothetical protein
MLAFRKFLNIFFIAYRMICKTDGSCGIKGKGRGLFGDDCEHQSDCFEKLLCISAKCDQVDKIQEKPNDFKAKEPDFKPSCYYNLKYKS